MKFSLIAYSKSFCQTRYFYLNNSISLSADTHTHTHTHTHIYIYIYIYIYISWLDDVLQTPIVLMKENALTLEKARSRR